MNKTHYILSIAALALVFSLPAVVSAEENSVESDLDVSSSVNVSAEDSTRPASAPKPRPAMNPTVREKLRADLDQKMVNLKANQENRNNILEQRRGIATTTRADVKNIRVEGRGDMRTASTSGERRDVRIDMRANVMLTRKNALVKELNLSLANLTQIRGRIASRIEKSSAEGHDMTSSKALLVTADAKLVVARDAVAALAAYTPSVSAMTQAQASTSLEVKPRELSNAALKAVKDARETLGKVVTSIAKSIGARNGTATTTIETRAEIQSSGNVQQ